MLTLMSVIKWYKMYIITQVTNYNKAKIRINKDFLLYQHIQKDSLWEWDHSQNKIIFNIIFIH